MSTNVFLVAHPQKELFEIGGSWMHTFPEEVLVEKVALRREIRSRLQKSTADAYVDWLCDKMWEMVVRADFDVSIVLEGGHDRFVEDQYRMMGTYFPLRDTVRVW